MSSGSENRSTRGPAAVEPKRKILAGLIVATIGIAAVVTAFAIHASLGSPDQLLIYYVVKRADLPITVTERGNLESQHEERIICDVDDIENDNLRGTQVQFVVPNGSSVAKDQLLVELNTAGHIERRDRQIIATEKARSEQITANVWFNNQQTQNETSELEADRLVQLAKLDYDEFLDQEGGTFQINLQEVELAIQEARASKLIEETNLEGVEQLYRLRYRTSGELAQARLSALKAERVLASAVSKRKKLVGYQYQKTEIALRGAWESAQRALDQLTLDNQALLDQARAAMEAADASLKKEEERLARYERYIENCKIYAPKSGMVAYHVCRWHPGIREGSTVQLRDHLLSIPDLSRMQVKASIHESVLDQIHRGLPVTVRVEAFPERSYDGTVDSVSVLPDAEEKAKIYTTIVKITERVDHLKPGMTALCEIHVDLLRDVISVPVQAVVQIRRDNWCYVDNGNGIERRILTLGETNDKFIEIRAGLDEGDRVVLNPTALMENEVAAEDAISPDRDIPDDLDIDQIDAAKRLELEDKKKRDETNSSSEPTSGAAETLEPAASGSP